MNRHPLSRRKHLAALVGVLLTVAGLTACRQGAEVTEAPGAAGTPLPTIDVATLPTCQTEETEALGMGLTEFATEAEAREALASSMLFPDPATFPEDTRFVKAYYNAAMQGAYKQSTIGIIYHIGDQSEGEKAISIIGLARAQPFVDPVEPHEKTTTRGGLRAYAFEPPFREGLHSLQWQEECRIYSVIADLPADEVARIAEAMSLPADAD